MAGERRMYLGTPDGVLVLGEQDGRWEEERRLLPGKHIRALCAPGGTPFLYAKDSDGVYASSDSGRSFDRVFEGNIYTLDVDPASPETVFVGVEPVAMFKSTDCGDSWVELEALRRQPDALRDKWWFPQYPYDGHVKHVHIERRDSSRIYVAIEHGGFMRTDDGGATWEDVSDGIEYIDCHIVHSHPTKESFVFGGTARGFYRSEDYGRNWIQSEEGLTRDDVGAFAVLGGERPALFLTATKGSPPSWLRPSGAESAVFRSQDDGVTWHQLGGGLPESMVRPTSGLRVDPIDGDRIYVADSDFTGNYSVANGAAKGAEVWVSPDRGDSWTRIYETPGPAELLSVSLS